MRRERTRRASDSRPDGNSTSDDRSDHDNYDDCGLANARALLLFSLLRFLSCIGVEGAASSSRCCNSTCESEVVHEGIRDLSC